ncbi:MAG TPA: hypothetical protein VNH18_34510 [Bryobacteraceae bacterium]|nr:hypothetical protein [Bryobacteraceae bacterium]
MRSLWLVFILAASPLLAQQATAPTPELGLTLAGISAPGRTTAAGNALSVANGVAFQVNYGRFLRSYKYADLNWEVNFAASPHQNVTTTAPGATPDYASFFFTPGVRIKFYPKNKLSPWAVGGGGYALYVQNTSTIAGAANTASRTSNTGALEFGGGLDYRWSPRLSFRIEARDFYTGSPNFNVPVEGRGQFNFVAGGGVVFHLGLK